MHHWFLTFTCFNKFSSPFSVLRCRCTSKSLLRNDKLKLQKLSAKFILVTLLSKVTASLWQKKTHHVYKFYCYLYLYICIFCMCRKYIILFYFTIRAKPPPKYQIRGLTYWWRWLVAISRLVNTPRDHMIDLDII